MYMEAMGNGHRLHIYCVLSSPPSPPCDSDCSRIGVGLYIYTFACSQKYGGAVCIWRLWATAMGSIYIASSRLLRLLRLRLRSVTAIVSGLSSDCGSITILGQSWCYPFKDLFGRLRVACTTPSVAEHCPPGLRRACLVSEAARFVCKT